MAIVLGLILAVQAQKWIERATEERKERMLIFRTLMRTRANVLSREHVAALNMIRRIYSPRGHEQELAENQEARRLLLKLLRGEQPLKIQEEHKES